MDKYKQKRREEVKKRRGRKVKNETIDGKLKVLNQNKTQ